MAVSVVIGRRSRLAALTGLLLGSAAPVLAQDPPATEPATPAPATPTVDDGEGPRSYTPADFARFAPQNALDMLRQVPGFIIRSATVERGLGQATGNVLINGQRISGKSNDVVTELSRVSARNVIRIDIVDGATLDVPGLSGQVANIIVKSTGGMKGQFSWSPEFRPYNTTPRWSRADISVNGKQGPVEYTLGLENGASRSGADGGTDIFGPDLSLIERRSDQWAGSLEMPKASARFVLDGPGSSIGNLNASYRRIYYDFREDGVRLSPSGARLRDRVVLVEEGGYDWEIGGDYEFALAGGRLKLIGLNRSTHVPYSEDVVTSFANLSPSVGSRYSQVADESERIGRLEYRWKMGGADWQISAEGAFNSYERVADLFELTPSGEYEEIDLSGASGEVREDRYEVMASYGRTLSPKLSIQLSAGGEYSNLRQIGEGGLSRTFWRPKGTFNAAWKPIPRLDVNLKLQRRVGQLNFGDFLASVNLSNDSENAGNPELVPFQSWDVDLETIRNLGRYGSTTLRLYGRFYEDIVDIIPIGATGESPGNIDQAKAYGAEWKTTFNFDPLGWKGAKIDTRVQLQRSRVDDPLTGEPRSISNFLLHLFEGSLRHDVPDTDWAWGGSASYVLGAKNYRLTEVGRQWEGPVFASLYAEHKDVFGLTVRATLGNVLGATSMWDRTVYVGRRTGPVAFFERRDRRIGPIFSFSVRGKF